jgi:hypothetical protein
MGKSKPIEIISVAMPSGSIFLYPYLSAILPATKHDVPIPMYTEADSRLAWIQSILSINLFLPAGGQESRWANAYQEWNIIYQGRCEKWKVMLRDENWIGLGGRNPASASCTRLNFVQDGNGTATSTSSMQA